MSAYDPNNVFARILRGEIPCKKVFESPHSLAFLDIAPQAPVHILVIPKGPYIDATAFGAEATPAEHADFCAAIAHIVQQENLASAGYRLIANTGPDGGQEVPHYHVHILGGKAIGPMVSN